MLLKAIDHAVEILMQPLARLRLRDGESQRRFQAVAPRYAEVCRTLLGSSNGSDPVAPGYDWSSWAATVRQSFTPLVPADFLDHPTLTYTMVYSRRGGIRNTAFRTRVVRDAYGETDARRLLREDPVGSPVITDLRYVTSANRAHHAMHLAAYRQARRRDVWEGRSVIEWGGGYGDMARVIRRMNQGVTYTIIDLPELGALQYVYLSSVEGEHAVHVVVPGSGSMESGKINLMSVYDLPRLAPRLKADSFISTWAITESPAAAQKAVADARFYGAQRILIASMLNENNALAADADRIGMQRMPIAYETQLPPGNEYWFL